ncbi:MAG: TolC family protein [Sphingomonadales bacterium]|nr:TolC family protein [Sphingomonadales bacterium]
MQTFEAARATFRQARAAIIPVAGIESGAGPDRADRQPSTSNVPQTSYALGATFAYEVDLFGRLRAATSAAKADTAASAAALDAARVMVAADTAAAYINICGANAAIKLAQAQIATHEQSVALVARRVARGSVSSLELAQSKALLERTRATLFPMEADRKRSLQPRRLAGSSTRRGRHAANRMHRNSNREGDDTGWRRRGPDRPAP